MLAVGGTCGEAVSDFLESHLNGFLVLGDADIALQFGIVEVGAQTAGVEDRRGQPRGQRDEGDEVIIEAVSATFYANMIGIAMDAGKQGDAIRVRNSSSGKIITAYPIAKGRVETRF